MEGYKNIEFSREGSFQLSGFVKEKDYELLKDFFDDYDGYVEDVKFFANADEDAIKKQFGILSGDEELTDEQREEIKKAIEEIDKEMDKDDAKTEFIETIFTTMLSKADIFLDIFNDYANKVLEQSIDECKEKKHECKKGQKDKNKSDSSEEYESYKGFLQDCLKEINESDVLDDAEGFIVEFTLDDEDPSEECSCNEHCECGCEDEDPFDGFFDDPNENRINREKVEEYLKDAIEKGVDKGKKAGKDLSKITGKLIKASQPAINSFIDTLTQKLEEISKED